MVIMKAQIQKHQRHPTKDSLYLRRGCWLFLDCPCTDRRAPGLGLKIGDRRNCRSVCLSPRRSFLAGVEKLIFEWQQQHQHDVVGVVNTECVCNQTILDFTFLALLELFVCIVPNVRLCNKLMPLALSQEFQWTPLHRLMGINRLCGNGY